MIGMLISGGVALRDLNYDIDSVRFELQAPEVELIMLPDALMYIVENAQGLGKTWNDLASLIAGRAVYGPALIAGFNGDDVPESYVAAYMI